MRLDRRRTVHHLRLDRLTRPRSAHFLVAVYGERFLRGPAAALHARTGGNPFFLEEMLVAAGDADPTSSRTQPLPWTLAEIVRRQLDGLSGDERRVIDAAAVLGGGVSFDVLAAVTRMDEEEMIGHLRGLVGRGPASPKTDPDVFVFRHALRARRSRISCSAASAAALHEAALAALREAASDDLAGIAQHARRARVATTSFSTFRARGSYVLPRAGLVLSSVAPSRRTALVEDPDCLTLLETADARGVARRPRRRSPQLRGAGVARRGVTSPRRPRPPTW